MSQLKLLKPRKELKLNTKRSNPFEVYEIGGNTHNLECFIYHPNQKKKKKKKKKKYIYIYIYRLDEKWSKKQTTHRSMFNTDVSPFGLLQCIQTGITAILGKSYSVKRSYICGKVII